MLVHEHDRSRVFQNEVAVRGGLKQDLARSVDVFLVGDGNRHVDTALVLQRVVEHGSVHERAVRQDNDVVVRGVDRGVEERDVGYGSDVSCRVDGVTDLEGTEQHDHDTARDITETTLDRKSDSQSERAEDRDDGSGRDIEDPADHRDHDDAQRPLDQVRHNK